MKGLLCSVAQGISNKLLGAGSAATLWTTVCVIKVQNDQFLIEYNHKNVSLSWANK